MLSILYFTTLAIVISACIAIYNRDKLFQVSQDHFMWHEFMYAFRMAACSFSFFIIVSLCLSFIYFFWSFNVITS